IPPTPPTQPVQPVQAEQAQPEQVSGIAISFNGMECTFPLPEEGRQPIFLDIASAFSDDPTTLLAHSNIITVNGRFARLDEEIHDGDVIVIE
ncbi:MAG: hypothetical protein K2O14_11630, partial [Oscillospiraceae bacterium]|nr:hypothetical protein [Oscillospiraceae bacterium]